ncbi:MAG: helix-turn-helix transcriptional regulator [Firmicutes bacterium]|nr:helix-turn-helix transcriptional regulator [Bacillota bacterium]
MYAMDFAQVGANIQKELDIRGMTQQNLADALGISKQVMNKIIKGSKAINVNEISMIARVLQTSADDLLTVSELPAEDNWLTFMGMIKDQETMEKVNLIRTAIDEIGMLEELLYE